MALQTLGVCYGSHPPISAHTHGLSMIRMTCPAGTCTYAAVPMLLSKPEQLKTRFTFCHLRRMHTLQTHDVVSRMCITGSAVSLTTMALLHYTKEMSCQQFSCLDSCNCPRLFLSSTFTSILSPAWKRLAGSLTLSTSSSDT